MEKKKMRKIQFMALFWVILALAVVITATYAWFTFNPSTNVEPMSSTISQGDSSLLISNTRDGEYDISCSLTPESNPDVLHPVSTSGLDSFFAGTSQTPEGITFQYENITDSLKNYVIHGTVYLKSLNGACDVYLYQSGLSFGSDIQTLAAMRLGLKITTEAGTDTYIFKLDDMGATGSATSTVTVPESGTVVSSVAADNTGVYVKDPALNLSDYFAGVNSNDDTTPLAGTNALTYIQADEIATVEYWLYLEGCDDNCINDVQNRALSLQLSFAGVTRASND